MKNICKIIFLFGLLVSLAFAQRKLVNIEVVGNTKIGEWELLSALTIDKPKWYDGIFGSYPSVEYKKMRDNLSVIEAMYRNIGYLGVKTKLKLTPLPDDTMKIIAYVLINEGKLFRINSIDIDLPSQFDKDSAFAVLEMKMGDIFSPYRTDDSKSKLWRWIADRGYPYAVVNLNWTADTVDTPIVDIKFSVDCGKKVHFGRIYYKGLRNTKKFLLKRELGIKQGDLYSFSTIETSKEELYSTGLFRIISIELADTFTYPETVDVIVNVMENRRGWYGFSLNFGASKEYDFTTEFVGEWGHRNIWGNGQSVSLKASAQTEMISKWQFISHRYEMQFTEPWTFAKKLPSILTLYFEPGVKTAQYPYRVQKFGGNLNLIKRFGPILHSIGLTYERADIYGVLEDEAEEIKQEQGIFISRELNYTYQRDVRNNPLMPTDGSLIRMSTDFVGGPLGGDEHYLKVDVLWGRYLRFPIWHNAIYANRFKMAVMGNTKKGTDISIHNRLATGGANSVRGFDELSIGPRTNDSIRTMLGGKVLFLFSSEIRFPIIWKFWGHTFIDLGQVWYDWKDVNPNDIRASTGAGLAFITPVGPLRFDYAVVLSKHPYDPKQFSHKWHITLMYPY